MGSKHCSSKRDKHRHADLSISLLCPSGLLLLSLLFLCFVSGALVFAFLLLLLFVLNCLFLFLVLMDFGGWGGGGSGFFPLFFLSSF